MENHLQNLLQKSINYFSNNQLDQAEEICLEILRINSFYPEAYNILSAISNSRGNLDNAIEYINKAININPNNHLYFTNLGEFYKRKGDNNNAEISLRKAVSLNLQFSGSRYNLANVLKVLGKKEEAIHFYNEAIKINNSDWQSYQNMGNTFRELKNYPEAAKCYWHAIRIKPDLFDAETSLANLFYEMKDYYKAEYHFKNVLNNQPDNDVCLKSLAVIFENQGRVEEASALYKKYSERKKDDFTRKFHLESLEPFLYMTNYEIDLNRKNLSELIDKHISMDINDIPDNGLNENIQPNIQLGYHGRDNKELKEKYAQIFRNTFKNEKSLNTPNKKISIENRSITKIKIGYFISSGHEGIFSKFFHRIINNLRDEFEQFIICPYYGWEKFIAKNIKNQNVNFIDITDNFSEISEKIKDLKLDILYHWEIGTDNINYFLPFLKLATVECTSIGWPDTTGIPEMDYFISSELIESENADKNYSEKLIKFKNLPLLCEKPEIKEIIKPISEFGINFPNKFFLCCQNLRKIHPDFDILVRDILLKDKTANIVFIEHEQKFINNLLKARLKITAYDVYNRIIFVPPQNYHDYLSLIFHADIILDTLYFGGTNTSYEAFAMNRPIVTLPWTHERGRYTLGCYKQMGIEDCIVNNFQEYSDKVIKIATDRSYRDKIIAKIKANNHLLFDDVGVIEEYRQFFKKAFNLVNN